MRSLHIAIAATMSRPGALEANLAAIEAAAARSAEVGADLLLTPEMSACGYGAYPEVLATAEPAGCGPIYERLAAIATATGVTLCAGFVEAIQGHPHISHYIVRPGGASLVQRKHRVTTRERPLHPYRELIPDPENPASPGQPVEVEFNTFDVRGVRCGLLICADEGLADRTGLLARHGVDLFLLPVGAGGPREERVSTEELATREGRARYLEVLETVFYPRLAIAEALETGRAFAAVNLIGYDGRDHHHVGHGSIVNRWGEVPGFFHGIPHLERQRPCFAHARLEFPDRP